MAVQAIGQVAEGIGVTGGREQVADQEPGAEQAAEVARQLVPADAGRGRGEQVEQGLVAGPVRSGQGQHGVEQGRPAYRRVRVPLAGSAVFLAGQYVPGTGRAQGRSGRDPDPRRLPGQRGVGLQLCHQPGQPARRRAHEHVGPTAESDFG